jgi:hypothetical protein
MITYEAWRVTFQSSEAAARAAYHQFNEVSKLCIQLRDEIDEKNRQIDALENNLSRAVELMEGPNE